MFRCLFPCEREGGVPPESRGNVVNKLLSTNRPLMARTDMEKLRFELVQFIKLHHTPKDPELLQQAQDLRPRIREILSDARLKGHFGHVSMYRTQKMDHARLWMNAANLEQWLERWLR